MKQCKAFISGVWGPVLTDEEKAFIADHQPWGFILFARNVCEADQLRKLTDDLRKAAGRDDLKIFVDQEGGSVQRLRPPLAPDYPSAARLGAIYSHDKDKGRRAAWLMSRLHAFDLGRYGLTADCLPVLDVPIPGSHDVIGDRAYGHEPQIVTDMGGAAALGLKAGGILPVMKHIPGHGRATVDTHQELARVSDSLEILRQSDFVPFKALSCLPCAMTSHVLYEAVDHEHAATLSQKVIENIIRGEIGFDGLLMTDDVTMKALEGDVGNLAQRALAAGCDLVLHCHGDMKEKRLVADNTRVLEGKSLQRAQSAAAWVGKPDDADEQVLRQEFSAFFPSAVI